jgi:vacuolar protein sorting-associated protein 35
MNRLSSYAQSEGQDDDATKKQKSEEEAVSALMERLRVSKEKKDAEPKKAEPEGGKQADGESDSLVEREPEESIAGTTLAGGEASQTTPEDGVESPEGEKSRGIPANVKLYEIFFGQVTHLVQAQRLPIQDTIPLLVSLANLALNIYPERLDYIDQVLSYANEKVAQYVNSADLHSATTQSSILGLLLAPIKAFHSLFTALALPNFLPLLHAQTYPTRRAVAGEVAKSILRNQIKVTSVENLQGVLEILRVLIKEGTQQPAGYPGLAAQRRSAETDETIEEQGWLARLTHLLQGKDNDTQLRLIQAAGKIFAEGNERIKYTTPPLLTLCIKLARSYKKREHFEDNWEAQSSQLYKFMHTSISSLYTRVNGAAELCLRLFVSAGQIADQNGFEEVAYEFFAQAFTIYEEAISDSRAQFQAVCVFAGALHQTRGFSRENYDTLITKCALHGSKLLKKPDQCRAVYLASHLWWANDIRAKGEEESPDVSCSRASTRRLLISRLAISRWQESVRVSPTCVESRGRLYGLCRLGRIVCRDSQPVHVLLRSTERTGGSSSKSIFHNLY